MASSKEKVYALITQDKIQIHIPKQTAVEKLGGILCHICNQIFAKKRSYDTHYRNQHKGEVEAVYSCVVCKKQITGYPSFRNHCYLNHVVKNKFQCKHCDKSFCKQSILNNHVAAVHSYKCSSCDEKFTSKIELNTHKSTHNKSVIAKTDPPYDCFKCGKLLKSIDMCESHIDDHTEIVYTCPICNEALSSKAEAIKHLTVHYDDNLPIGEAEAPLSMDCSIAILGGIRCCLCDMVFPNKADINAHFLNEHDEKTIVYTCNVCGKQYDKYSTFGSHCHFHIAKDKFQCDQCTKSFPRLSLLVIHTEAFHSEYSGNKPFACDKCTHGFMTRSRLREHKRIVHDTDEFDLKCTYPGCFAVLSSPRDAIVHRKRHLSAEAWCRTCGLKLASARAAAAHLDAHAALRLRCPACGRGYRSRRRLLPHVRAHYAALVHLCRVCGKAYAALARLAQHQRSHADPAERRHRCHLCTKTFDKPYDLRQHLDTHSGLRDHICIICTRGFSSASNLRKHTRRCQREPANKGANITATPQEAPPLNNLLVPTHAQEDVLLPDHIELFDEVSGMPAPPVSLTSISLQTSPELVWDSEPQYHSLGVPHEDDHILPHIDPLLTIKPEKMYVHDPKLNDFSLCMDMVKSEQKFNPVLAIGVESLVRNLLPDNKFTMYSDESYPMYEPRG